MDELKSESTSLSVDCDACDRDKDRLTSNEDHPEGLRCSGRRRLVWKEKGVEEKTEERDLNEVGVCDEVLEQLVDILYHLTPTG